jgi:subtilisin family serine protease
VWTNTREVAGNGIDDDGNGYVDDVNGWNFVDGNNNVQDCDGHGTHVSGIVRGTTQFIFDNNNMPAPIVKIMPVKFLDCYGSGTTAGAIAAIYYAVSNGAKVLNNSWGGGGYSRALHEAILYSYNSKTVFVAAAGNSRANIDVSKTYPASYPVPNVISVLATRSDDSAATEFTNYGVATVPVGAPGSGIWSTYPDFWGDPWCDDDGNASTYEGCFRSMSGTSMAAPFVSAIAALMANERPTMTGYQIKQLIMANADRKSGLANYVSTSSRVNSLSSVVASKTATLDPNQPYYEIGFSDEERGLASAIASSGAGGCGMVRALSSEGTGGGDTPYGLLGLLTGLMVLPVFLASRLKKKTPSYKREFTRYQIQTKVRVRTLAGDEHEVDLSTLSIGGAGFKSEMDLSLGSQLSFKLQSPNGQWMEVKGHVVWAGEGHTHGVKFDDQLSPNLVMALVRG